MFIERSAARVRTTRTLFVLLGILPCAGLCGWAAVLHSDWHRQAVERTVERAVGLPCRIGGIEHLRPGAARWRDVRLSAPSGRVLLAVPAIEVECSPRELRVAIGRVECSPDVAEGLRNLAHEWLERPARFPLDCVVDVAEFSWGPGPRPSPAARGTDRTDGGAGGLHVECVAAHGSRAIRVRRDNAARQQADEVRLVAHGPRDAGGPAPAEAPPEGDASLEIRGDVAEPLPIAVFERLAGFPAAALPWGDEAAVCGTLDAACVAGVWSGTARGRIDRLDLAATSRHLPHRLAGEAAIDVDQLAWSRGRVTSCDVRLAVGRGRFGQQLLDALVAACGCRPGPAYRSLARDDVRDFDDLSIVARIVAGGMELRAAPGRDGAIARVAGISILDEPRSRLPLAGLAWLLSPPGIAAVPASKSAALLLRWLDLSPTSVAVAPQPAGEPPARDPAARPQTAPQQPSPERFSVPGRRNEF